MKKFLISGLLLIPFLFQNCTVELREIDSVVSPIVDFRVENDNYTEESLSARGNSEDSEEIS